MVLSSNYALDNLARSGIIDFDANAYIKGTKPRYAGSPNTSYGSGLPGVTTGDTYGPKSPYEISGNYKKSNKILTVLGVTGATGVLTAVFGSKIKALVQKIKNKRVEAKANKANKANTGKTAKKVKETVKNTTKNTAEKSKVATKTVKEKGSSIFKKAGNWFKNKCPKGVKIAGLVAAGLIGLNEIKNIIQDKLTKRYYNGY